MVSKLFLTSMILLSVSFSANAQNENVKSNKTIERLENQQVNMLAKILRKKGRGMIDHKFDEDKKIANRSQSTDSILELNLKKHYPN